MCNIAATVTAARPEGGRLYVGNPTPDADQLCRADTKLAAAKTEDRTREHIRETGHPIERPQTGHLVGQLLMRGGIPRATFTLIEKLARDAVAAAQAGASE